MFTVLGGIDMSTSKPILLPRMFRREESLTQPAATPGRVSKSEIRALFSDVFEEKGLVRNAGNDRITDEAA